MAAVERGNKRKVVVEIADYGTEVTYCPPDVECEVFDYHNAGEEGHPSPEEMEKRADEEKARARSLAGTVLDEEDAVAVLRECRERFERGGDRNMLERIDDVLRPVAARG